ncbi:MAG: anthranilate phosphoribosyltransferase [Rhodospirillales bacterium]
MSDALKPILAKLAGGESLSADEAEGAFGVIMSGEATAAQIGAILMALRIRGETVDEITGAVRTMRAKALAVAAPDDAIDVVGTGGDASGTYNISTGAAIVVAACGVPVAKHGNKALSSKSGAADVLAALGVDIEADLGLVERAIREAGIGFLMAPRHHSAMKHVGGPRVEMGVRTVFNLLGPLSNPAGVKRQFTGVFSGDWVEPLAQVLRNLGCEAAWVVHGSDGLDEMTTTGPSAVAQLKDGDITTFEVTPEDAGLPLAKPEDLKGGDAKKNADALTAVLAGEPGPYRDVVLYNAAGALIVAGKAGDLAEGVALAADALDSGKARAVLETMVAITNAGADQGADQGAKAGDKAGDKAGA